MPINTPDPDHEHMLEKWQRCRDCYSGSDAVKARKTKYLPALSGQAENDSDYKAYLNRALFYPATGRTVLGLLGLVFGKPITMTNVPKDSQELFYDVTKNGMSLNAFGIDCCTEVLVTGRVGMLVDTPATPSTKISSYTVKYLPENIISCKVKRMNGIETLVRVILRETVTVPNPEDEYCDKEVVQLRELYFDAQGFYTIQLWQIPHGKTAFERFGQPILPTRRSERLDFIPFVFCNTTNISSEIGKPPLEDLVDVNLSHFRTSADREHGAHFTALPTAYVSGYKEKGVTLGIGSGTAWIFPDSATKVGYLEFSGSGLGALKELMEEKRTMMQTLGARLLENQKSGGVEAADTVRMRHSAEGSVLAIMSGALSQALTQVAAWILWWSGKDMEVAEEVSVKVNTDLLEKLTPQELSALVAAWQSNAMSHKTLYYNLQKGEVTRPDITFEEEQEEIKNEAPDLEPPDPNNL